MRATCSVFRPWLRASFNIGSIIGGVGLGYWLDPKFGPKALIGLAIGTLIGGAMQLAVQLPSLFKAGFLFPALISSGRIRE
jgi:peptidoglycan biosynthesis protein MviN/MurJ (putative lipid II flippase)